MSQRSSTLECLCIRGYLARKYKAKYKSRDKYLKVIYMKRYSAQKVKKSYKKEKASELSIGKGFE